jgi:hypothetical protein
MGVGIEEHHRPATAGRFRDQGAGAGGRTLLELETLLALASSKDRSGDLGGGHRLSGRG